MWMLTLVQGRTRMRCDRLRAGRLCLRYSGWAIKARNQRESATAARVWPGRCVCDCDGESGGRQCLCAHTHTSDAAGWGTRERERLVCSCKSARRVFVRKRRIDASYAQDQSRPSSKIQSGCGWIRRQELWRRVWRESDRVRFHQPHGHSPPELRTSRARPGSWLPRSLCGCMATAVALGAAARH